MKCDVYKKIVLILVLTMMNIGYASAQDTVYNDNFDILDTTRWTPISLDIWQITDSTLSSSGGHRPGLIFEDFEDTQYICEVDLTADKNMHIQDYAVIGIYIYYEDKENYGRVIFVDDNRGSSYYDIVDLEKRGVGFKNTNVYTNTTVNTSIEFNPPKMYHLKVIRLNKNIYIYLNDRLSITSEFADENPEGKIGLDIYACTGYFDNFKIRSIDMKNASGYVNKLKLTLSNPTLKLNSIYSLSIEGISNGRALFSLKKYGETVDTSVGSEGDTVVLNFENGNEGVNFKIKKLIDAGDNSAIWLEEIISASTDEGIEIEDVSIGSSYYQGEDITIEFSIHNKGGVKFEGTPEIKISTESDSQIIYPELDLNAGESERCNVVLKAPAKPGTHILKFSSEHSNMEKSVEYKVKALNPSVTIISTNLKENNGIRGTINIGSIYPSESVDWDTTASVKVYSIVNNGKKEVCSKEIQVISNTFDLMIPYEEFYRGDGQYLVIVNVGGMQDTELFEVAGQDYIYLPTEEKLPPTVISNDLYPQILLFLIGMFAALSVKNHIHQKHKSLPLNLLAIICGAGILISALIKANAEMAVSGVMLLGIGLGTSVGSKKDSAVRKLILRDSHLHDFAGMLLVFLSAVYIVAHAPEWSFLIIVGTLIAYSTGLNLYNKGVDSEKEEGTCEESFLIPLE